MTKKQKSVLFQIIITILFISFTTFICFCIWGEQTLASSSALKRAILILLTMGIWELVFVLVRARQRFFIQSEIDGGQPKSGSSSEIQARILNNTTEQLLVAFPILLFTALFSVPGNGILIILLGIFFNMGRLLFWLGYHYMPTMRGFGFCLTCYPIVFLYLYAILCLSLGWSSFTLT